MSNAYFQFKQFTIQQDKCAMKVSTDACIQGAWTPVRPHVQRVLDIGAGTGLLSLMLAQRAPHIAIDAIELDEAAALQASENVAASPFADRIHVQQGDILNYMSVDGYDLIVCNPPFFNNSLLGPVAERNVARHTVTLTHTLLIQTINRLLNAEGYAAVLLPYTEQKAWEQLVVQHGLYTQGRLLVKPYEQHQYNRVVSVIGHRDTTSPDEELTIYREQNKYTPAAVALLGAFYAKEMQ